MDIKKTLPAIILPSLNPDEKMVELIEALRASYAGPIIVINDGSTQDKDPLYEKAESLGCILLKHFVNMGKGRALKDAFNYYLNTFPEGSGVVTADADGQHLPEDILKVVSELQRGEKDLILGVRDFYQKDVPFKSRFGNVLTRNTLRFFSGGLKISDTQTGLRGISVPLLKNLLTLPGERFEYETKMLLVAYEKKFSFSEVVIRTVYFDSNRETHFAPIKDSFRIYRILFANLLGHLLRYLVSSGSSAIVDIVLFSLLFKFFTWSGGPRLILSTAIARFISGSYNYYLNRHFVFNKKGVRPDTSFRKTFFQYWCLCIVVFLLSYYGLKLVIHLTGVDYIVWKKIVIDVILFLLCYFVQWMFIFRNKQTCGGDGILNATVASHQNSAFSLPPEISSKEIPKDAK